MSGAIKFLRFWLPPLLWMGVIFFFSAQPSLGTSWGIWDTILRKIFHMGEFAGLAFLLIRAFRQDLDFKKAVALGCVMSFIYAASDEYHQSFVFGRVGAISDVLIDTVGILGAGLCLRSKPKESSRES